MADTLLKDRVVAALGDLYDVEHEIGRGGSPVVYRAIDVRRLVFDSSVASFCLFLTRRVVDSWRWG